MISASCHCCSDKFCSRVGSNFFIVVDICGTGSRPTDVVKCHFTDLVCMV